MLLPAPCNINWNQVCNGGMVAAAIAVAEIEPELAAKTIHRALDGMVNALAKYGPDGVYPEGATYWRYGTSFTVTTAAMFESAFGTDFGVFNYPGFEESAVFRILSVAPSGLVYNFADCGERAGRNGDITLAWFASKTGNKKSLGVMVVSATNDRMADEVLKRRLRDNGYCIVFRGDDPILDRIWTQILHG